MLAAHEAFTMTPMRTRTRLLLMLTAAGTFAGIAVPVAAAEDALRPRRALAVDGTGVADPDPCLDRPGRCGWMLKGTLAGIPIAHGTFFSVIDDDGAANPDHCVPATYAGLLGAGPDQTIAHVAEGEVCPDGAGGSVFAERFRITGGLGPFDGIRGRGHIVAVVGADGSGSIDVTGTVTMRR